MQKLKVKCSVNFSRIMAHKNTWAFSHDKVENELFKASVFWMNDWCDLSGYQISEQTHFFTRRAVDVVSEACFTAMTGDRHDERAAMNFSMIIFALTPSWLVWILTVMPVWLYFGHHFCFVLFCFWTLNFVYYTSVSCVWFLLPYVSLKIFETRNAYFVFSFEDFRIYSRFNNVNYGAWYVCKPLFGSSVPTYRLACFEISLSIIEKKLKRSSGKGRT